MVVLLFIKCCPGTVLPRFDGLAGKNKKP